MTIYVLIGLALSLAGVAGLQFFYMIYLERMDKDQKKRLRHLEMQCSYLTRKLKNAEAQIADQTKIIESVFDDFEEETEIWADVIEE